MPWGIIGDFSNSFSTATPLVLNTLATDNMSGGEDHYAAIKLVMGRSYRITFESTTTQWYWFYNPYVGVVGSGTLTTDSFSYAATQTETYYFIIWGSSGTPASYNLAVIDETACSASCTGIDF